MSLSDTQSLTIAGVANSLPRVSTNGGVSVYQTPDERVKMTVSHQYGKRKRTLIRIDLKKIAADPLTAVNTGYSMSLSTVIDRPLTGFAINEVVDLMNTLSVYITESSSANATKIVGGES